MQKYFQIKTNQKYKNKCWIYVKKYKLEEEKKYELFVIKEVFVEHYKK